MGEMYTNVAGVQRRVINTYANINGVWRQSTEYVNIDGIYREIDDFSITESKIIGFKIVYISNHNAKYPDLPNLSYNPNIPATLSYIGNNAKSMDLLSKGVMFQYNNTLEPDQLEDNLDQEGILKYTGHLYAFLANGLVVDVTPTNDIVGWETRYPVNSIPGMSETWNLNKMNNLDIQIYSKIQYRVNGINTEGWNRIFTKTNYTGQLSPVHQMDEFTLPPEFIHILPVSSRSDDFYEFAEIGIARDIHTPGRNMVGSHGYFSHNFVMVNVNGVSKPFAIEICN